uniref:Putative ral-gtpase effector rlip76 n=1 Tax=Phlebotomus kandelakii TaxID=1109342 RepID=A0A6B2EED6_9DIPT
MEFESPDVEKEFPGLFASQRSVGEAEPEERDGGRRRQRKDKGYATLSGDSSPEKERPDTKSPKGSKKKAFKFATPKTKMGVKEKRDKSRPRPPLPVFGVDLELAVKRSPCLDGVALPLPLRHALDCLRAAKDKRVSPSPAQKASVADIRAHYDARRLEAPSMCPTVAWDLLKLFLTSLPHPLIPTTLGTALMTSSAHRVISDSLSEVQRTALGWLVKHVGVLEANNYPIQLIATSARLPQRLLQKLAGNPEDLFVWCRPTDHIEPLVASAAATPPLPDHPAEVAAELGRQEHLLALLHADMSEGFVCEQREELLWCVQRIVTHLKRRLRQVRLQWSAEGALYLPHSTHPDAEEVVRLQMEHKQLMGVAEDLLRRVSEVEGEIIEMTKESAIGQMALEEETQLEGIVQENVKILTMVATLADKIHETTMENVQLQVDVKMEQEALREAE